MRPREGIPQVVYRHRVLSGCCISAVHKAGLHVVLIFCKDELYNTSTISRYFARGAQALLGGLHFLLSRNLLMLAVKDIKIEADNLTLLILS